MDSGKNEETFFQIATPSLINKWIKKYGSLALTETDSCNDCVDKLVHFSNLIGKKTRFIELNEALDSTRKIKLIRGSSNIDSVKVDSTYDERRGSLQIMRQFNSLPTSNSNNLGALINSKIKLPKFAQDENHLRCLRETCWTEFFVEIVSGILAELDSQSLIQKIKTNMKILTYSDSCSLHVSSSLVIDEHLSENVKGFLTAILKKCKKENKAQTYKDDEIPEFAANCGIKEILSLPIHLKCLDIVRNQTLSGALVLVNPTRNQNILQHLDQFLQCCARALYNATLFETYSAEFRRNKMLLESLHGLYEEQNSLAKFMKKSLYTMKELIKCDEVAIFLLESEFERQNNFDFSCNLNAEDKFSTDTQDVGSRKIAKMVCINGETFKYRSEENFEELKEIHISSMICKPIWDSSNRIIGVSQVINKREKNFSQNDEDILEAITIFCTVGIANCRLYENMMKSNARAQVALEALSYHTSASVSDVSNIMNKTIPSFENVMLGSHRFDDFSLSNEDMVLATVKLFSDLDILSIFSIKRETLYKWVLTVMKNYRNIAYHNWCHAFNVFHMMICLFQTKMITQVLLDIEILGLIVGCLCHDLDHRGTNNNFQIKTDSPLAQLYGNKATLEHHHFNLTVMIMNSEGTNIFESLSTDQYSALMSIIRQSILATDLSRHFQNRDLFFKQAQTKNCDWSSQEHREILRDSLMTSCDLAAATKQWPVAKKAAFLVMEEFFQQGDVEKNIYKIEPQCMMDRTRQNELPEIQIQWIESVCEPLFRHLTMVDNDFEEIYKQLMDNLTHWRDLISSK